MSNNNHDPSFSYDSQNRDVSRDTFDSDAIWKICVEGPTDEEFYKKFLDKYGKKILDVKDVHSEHQRSVIKAVKNNFEKHWYGIIDADYKIPKIDEFLKDRIAITDGNSLETMMVKYYGINDFEFLFTNTVRWKDSYEIPSQMVEKSLLWSYKIGLLREMDAQSNWQIPFTRKKEESYFYFDLLRTEIVNKSRNKKYNEKRKYSITCGIEQYLKMLLASKLQDVDSIWKRIDSQPFNLDDAWKICQGHDLLNFLEAINLHHSIIGIPNIYKNTEIKNKERSQVSHFEYDIIKDYDIRKFDKSDLRKWFDCINQSYEEKTKPMANCQKRRGL